MRSSATGFLIAFVAGFALLVGYGLRTDRALQLSDSVPPYHAVAEVPADQSACQAPVYREGAFTSVTFTPDRPEPVALRGRPRSPLALTVDGVRTGRRYASGSLPADRQPGGPRTVELAQPVSVTEPLRLCVRNVGRDGVVLWGIAVPAEADANPYIAGVRLTQSVATVEGRRVAGDFQMELGPPGDEPRPLVAVLPTAFERAARFKPPFVGAWTFWLLLGGLVLVAPVLLLRALADARGEEEPG